MLFAGNDSASHSSGRPRQLRQLQTDAERELWFHLRGGRLNGWKFRRQHPFPPYVLDFYCREAHLVVELDGSQHNESVDHTRTAFLNRHGLRLLQFWDNEVLRETQAVLEAIMIELESRTLTPTPLPGGEGL